MTFYELRNKIQVEADLEVLDIDGYLLQEGKNGETMWEDSLLDREVYLIIPGILTKIVLERWVYWWDVLMKCKFYFNNFELYNDDPDNETEPGVYGETEPLMLAVPKRLKTVLDKYDVFVTRFEVVITQYHHSIVYMYGEKIIKG